MVFNINDFATNGLTYGGVRPSLFQVDIPVLPAGIGGQGFPRKLALTCSSSAMPESNVQDVEVPYFGRKIKLAGDRTFQDWTVNILNDEDFLVRDTFEQWSNALNTMIGNAKTLPGNSYKVSATITQFSKDGNPTGTPLKQYSIIGLFPKVVSAMGVDWNNTNQIQQFQVTFAYDYWIPLTTSGININTGGTNGNLGNSPPVSL
jgi:hypothetical protein